MKHLSLVVLLASCANTSSQQPEGPRSTVRLASPIKVSWEEVSRSGAQAVVLAKIERVNKLDMPFTMSVELPDGVKVIEGRTLLNLMPNTEPVLITERLTLAYESSPAGDAVLKLDGDSGAMGFHYKVPYRFGRAAPEETGPAATGVAPGKGDKSFGPSVPLK